MIEKLIVLIPPRSSPLLRYGGVFAPNFKRRDEIILCPGTRKRKVSRGVAGVAKSQKQKVGSGSWARLLRRVFAIDVSAVLAAGLNWKSSLPCSIRPKSPDT
jgi:hypothetical protein